MIDHRHRFIFIHIPKTGGSSISQAFSHEWPAAPVDDPFSTHRVEVEGETHLPASLLRRSFPETFDAYFTACFVRNPWGRLLSAYWWLRRERRLGHEFQHWVREGFPDTPTRERNLFLKPCQLDWITDEDGSLLVDFIGRFEHLQRDFASICDCIGRGRSRLPVTNRTRAREYRKTHYSQHYDHEAREIVAKLYERDIEAFGFRFETGSGWRSWLSAGRWSRSRPPVPRARFPLPYRSASTGP